MHLSLMQWVAVPSDQYMVGHQHLAMSPTNPFTYTPIHTNTRNVIKLRVTSRTLEHVSYVSVAHIYNGQT